MTGRSLSSVTPRAGSHAVGPPDGELLVLTYREGLAQKVGHDLVLEVRAWQAAVEVGEDGMPVSVTLDADPRSLHVRRGLHGVKPLTDSDRASIRANIAKQVLGADPITFQSTDVDAFGRQLTVTGDLAMAGTTRPLTFTAALSEDGRVRATLTLTQSQWGIAPYRALMGALKVRDAVEVVLDAFLPPTSPLRRT